MESTSFAIIGPGVMGEALIAGLLRQKIAAPSQIVVAGPQNGRGQELAARYGVTYTPNNTAAAAAAHVILLAVKPQRLAQVLQGLHGVLQPEALAISIVAGATLQTLQSGLDHPVVVRAMPNTPGQIGQGITVWCTAPQVTPAQRGRTEQVLSALGEHIFVEDEGYLDMATALSGTGPAYVFLFLEALIDAGVHMGFPRRIAEQLVVQTLRGSVEYYSQKKDHPAHLRNEVTSPAGTSAAALYYLEKAGFRTAISRSVWAAYERSRELGRGRPAQDPEEKKQSEN